MDSATFRRQHDELTRLLNDPEKLIPVDTERKAFRLVEEYLDQPAAWVLYHRIICLLDGERADSEQLMHNCAQHLGEAFTPQLRLRMECDRVISGASYAELSYLPGVALAVASRFGMIQDELLEAADNQPECVALARYANGRGTLAARIPDAAHLMFKMSDEIWGDTVAPKNTPAIRNLVFLLRSAIGLGQTDEIERVQRRLRRASSATWAKYASPLMRDDGLAWFAGLNIRW